MQKVEPTPETMAKLQPVFIDQLDHDLKAIACRIGEAIEYLTASLKCRVSKYSERTFDGSPAIDWGKLQDEEILFLALWKQELQQRRIPYQVIRAIIIDNDHPAMIDRFSCWRPGTAYQHLVDSLKIFQSIVRNDLPESSGCGIDIN